MKILLAETVSNTPVTMQNVAAHSQEAVNFNAGEFSEANVNINFLQFEMILYSLLRL